MAIISAAFRSAGSRSYWRARLREAMGLHHCKGRIAVGLDADLAIVDLDARYAYNRENVRSSAGFSIYEGRTFTGKVLHTVVRGRFVLRDGETVDAAIGSGRFIKRRL